MSEQEMEEAFKKLKSNPASSLGKFAVIVSDKSDPAMRIANCALWEGFENGWKEATRQAEKREQSAWTAGIQAGIQAGIEIGRNNQRIDDAEPDEDGFVLVSAGVLKTLAEPGLIKRTLGKFSPALAEKMGFTKDEEKALEALYFAFGESFDYPQTKATVKRDLPAAPAQAGPVAWRWRFPGYPWVYQEASPDHQNEKEVEPLYATPTPGTEPVHVGVDLAAGPDQTVFHISQFIRDALAERQRQITEEGWTPEHDDAHHYNGELADAAACYALEANFSGTTAAGVFWPWEFEKWLPSKTPRHNLIKAMALLMADGERLDRAEAKKGGAA